jgi:hypothetical protein
MAESFLKEQLERIREMIEHMARAHDRAAELSHELERDSESATHHDSLAKIRDLRTHSSPSYGKRDRSDARSGPRRRHVARETSRRRRR